MYCSACGSPITPGLSFCNRCGMSLKERSGDSKSPLPVVALVLGMVVVAMSAMGLLLGGPIALKHEGQFGEELIVLFMFLTFLITAVTEIFLYRQLGRLTAQPKQPAAMPLTPPVDTSEYRLRLSTTLRSLGRSPNHCQASLRTRREPLNISETSRAGKIIRQQEEGTEMKRLLVIFALVASFATGCAMHPNNVVGSGKRQQEKREVASLQFNFHRRSLPD